MTDRTLPAEPKVLVRAENPDKAALIAVLLSVGVWDYMPPDERARWCDRGEALDTPSGRLLVAALEVQGGKIV